MKEILKDDISLKILFLCLGLSMASVAATTIGLFYVSTKIEKVESKIIYQNDRFDKIDKANATALTKLESLDSKVQSTGSKAESAVRSSDMVLNAVNSLGREIDKKK